MKLDKLEERLEALIEVRLPEYFLTRRKENKIAKQLAKAMHSNLIENGGSKFAPHIYTLVAHPNLIEEWKNDLAIINNLKKAIKDVASEADLAFSETLSFSLATDPELGTEEIKILVSQRVDQIADTKGMNTQKKEDDTGKVPLNAFLIIHGTKVFPLAQSVINIGRRMENTLTIDDPRVSRDHAQLRAVDGHYVIFDLNSTGGTYVNSQRSHQSVLYPGDVISLAGVPLIYGQDNPPNRADLTITTPFEINSASSEASSERETAILRDTASLNDKK
ncbi:MAG: DUF3662 domain-containing protein [Anaerolineae bacterium]|jgi:hypothetical protein|nr:DUF3662 domain-containing protein [Anaerolineae bacterium]MBT7075677.1 DUF3662 domain-containing protein [Anaerolineae bacterium]MBT7782101.1 DUF3662 domain-containing protein [Anaerolineae bacterium]